MCSTTTYPNLKVSEYCSALLPVPPLDEQQSIAAFLDRETGKIDALVAKEERLIKLLQEKRTALISHAVTQGLNPNAPMKDSGIPWLGRIPVHWALLRLNRLSKNMTAGPFGSSLTKDMYVPQGYRVYGQEQVIPADFSIGDYFISEEKYAEMRQYAVSPGDVLVSCVGTFGKIAVVPTNIAPGIINPRLLRLKPDSKLISSAYMGLVLTSRVAFDQMEEISRGGTMGVLNMGMLSTLLLPVPELSEQVDIVCHVQRETAKPDALISKVRAAIERLQEYRTALISAAVTGQIDVRRVAG
jgi:type I restriction enzyme S subunit